MGKVFFKVCKYAFFKGGKPKIGPGFFLRFLSIPFSIFEKGEKEKNGPGFFKIGEYTLFGIWKGNEQKVGLGRF